MKARFWRSVLCKTSGGVALPVEIIAQPACIFELELGVKRRLAQVRINQQHLHADTGEMPRQRHAGRRLALAGPALVTRMVFGKPRSVESCSAVQSER